MADNGVSGDELKEAFDVFLGKISTVIEDRVRRRVVNAVVPMIEPLVEDLVKTGVKEELQGFSGVVDLPKKKKKYVSIIRPCPVEGCTETAAPRHQNVCKHHSKTLSREQILLARDKANRPGGVWAKLKEEARA